ncbi:MAG: hypothetical protein Q8O43_03720 [Dehalococcoidia bacterium]|nr:hypothetical protein [Dehalococcoidia bacterium]
MRKTVIITDLTQMRDGDYVCIAGITESGQCIRPVDATDRQKGIPKSLLQSEAKQTESSRVKIAPRAKVEFDVYEVASEPPHIEDIGFNPRHIVNRGFCTEKEWEAVLEENSYFTVATIFDGLLVNFEWVKPGDKTKSLGTLIPSEVIGVELVEWQEYGRTRLRYLLSFRDETGHVFKRPVSDLNFRDYCYMSVKRRDVDRKKLEDSLTKSLKEANRVYLRVGLARAFKTSPLAEPRCFTQITGIHTFPDYLEGKTFADF